MSPSRARVLVQVRRGKRTPLKIEQYKNVVQTSVVQILPRVDPGAIFFALGEQPNGSGFIFARGIGFFRPFAARFFRVGCQRPIDLHPVARVQHLFIGGIQAFGSQ
jgi:hypothetical protein